MVDPNGRWKQTYRTGRMHYTCTWYKGHADVHEIQLKQVKARTFH